MFFKLAFVGTVLGIVTAAVVTAMFIRGGAEAVGWLQPLSAYHLSGAYDYSLRRQLLYAHTQSDRIGLRGGTATVIARYDSGDVALESNVVRLRVLPPEASVLLQHVDELKRCEEITACGASIEYLRYIKNVEAADRMIRLLHDHPFYNELAEAVFMQGRPSDVAALRDAAAAPNADKEYLLKLADYLERCERCFPKR